MDRAKKIATLSLITFFVCATFANAQTPQTIIWQVKDAARAIAFSPDAQLMLTGLQLRHSADGSLIRTFQVGYSGSSVVNADVFSPDGTLAAIAVQAFNKNLFLVRVADGAKLGAPISAHNNGTSSVTFSPNGQLLASGGRDGTVKIWHVPDMALLATLGGGAGYNARVSAVMFSKDATSVAIASQNGIIIRRISDGKLLAQLTTIPTISLVRSPDGAYVASGSNQIDQYAQCVDCTIKIWRTSDGAMVKAIPGNNNGVISLAFSPDSKELAAGSGDRTYNGVVRFFRVGTWEQIGAWYQDPNNSGTYVSKVAYAPYGRLLAYARADLTVIAAFDPF